MQTLLLTLLLTLSATAAAGERTEISRYAYLLPGSSHAQRHPLQVTVTQVRFPQEIANVGDALQYLLIRSGYRLDEQRSPWAQAILMPQPLPEVHRELGPISLAEALGVLAGDAWRLKVNPLYRTLIIEPAEEWRRQLESAPQRLEIERFLPSDAVHAKAYLEPASLDDFDVDSTVDEREYSADDYAMELGLPTSLHDPAEIFVDDLTLQQALDLLVPEGWRLRPEVRAQTLQSRISLISTTTWWDALTELVHKLGIQTQSELLLHVFEEQKLVVLEQT